MATHALKLKQGDPSNLCHRRVKRHTMVMMFEEGVGSDVGRIPVLFLPTGGTVWGGSLLFPPEPL